MANQPQYPSTFEGVLKIVERLRGPAGCPWDREQTRDTMRRYLLEECYELVEAIEQGRPGRIAEELGDVLLHLAFQMRLGIEASEFSEEEVFRSLIDKLVRRHPHVFGDAGVTGAREVESRWQELKRQESGDGEASALGGVPVNLPALSHAQVIHERAARTGFDWDDAEGVIEKVREELDELLLARSPQEREEEVGDALVALINVSRWLGVDAESAVRRANARFRRRFSLMERLSRERCLVFDTLSMAEKEALWREAKGLLERGEA